MKLLVAIHDASPAWEREIHELWALCQDVRVTPALLVVPAWHGASLLAEAPAFTRWLRDRAGDGAEIFLHGFRHDEVGGARSLRDHAAALGRTSGEAEFLSVARDVGERRLVEGARLLRGLGLEPTGFVPPAWLHQPWVRPAAVALGMSTFEDATGVTWQAESDAKQLHAPAVSWSGRSAWRAHASEWVARARRWHDGQPVVRVALHPMDMRHAVTRRSVARELQWWTERRPSIAYREAAAFASPARD